VARSAGNAKAASNWVMGELLRTLHEHGAAIGETTLAPVALADLIRLVDAGTISSSMAKEVFARMYESGRGAEAIVAAEGLAQNSDEAAVLLIVRRVLADHADAAAQVRAGKAATLGFLVGQVMKASGGTANPALVNRLLRREIGSS
jgi:aspartyl-tRNA(Asn)/glutamyl-tRNA(Gln) amidotransferase subunit B